MLATTAVMARDNHPALLRWGKVGHDPRRGYTLVEIMVVVVIIGILAAGTTAVVVRVIESQRRASTKLLLDTINNALATQASKLVDQTRRSVDATTAGDVDQSIKDQNALNWKMVFVPDIEGGFTPSGEKIYGAKDIPSYMQQIKGLGLTLPANFTGLTLPNGSVVGGTGKNDPSTADFESSFCLYMVLKGRFSALDPETLGRGAVQYAGPNKIPYIVDQWGDPIRYKPGGPGIPPKAESGNM